VAPTALSTEIGVEANRVARRHAESEVQGTTWYILGNAGGGYVELYAGRAGYRKRRPYLDNVPALRAGGDRSDSGINRTSLPGFVLLYLEHDSGTGYWLPAVGDGSPDRRANGGPGGNGEVSTLDAAERSNPQARNE
jgi:hypothetical protein